MANIIQKQVLVDSNKRAVIKITGQFDGSGQETEVEKINAANLAFSLNNNNYIKTGVTDQLARYKIDVAKLKWSIKDAMVKLFFDNTVAANLTNSVIAILGPGAGSFGEEEDAYVITNDHFGTSNGNIMATTLAAGANASYTIVIEVRKDPRHFGMGQHADPAAFNR
jgi:hypothetical protein